MAVREGDEAQAEVYRQLIINDFADSDYGVAMKDPDYFDNLRRMNEIQELKYQQAYDAYLANDNATVHALTAEMEKDYPLSKILPKFVFIDALSYVTEKDNDKFKERLTMLLEKWPTTDMTDMASGMLKGLKEGRNLQASEGGNQRGMLWDTRLGNDTTAMNENGQPAKFDLDPKKPHMLVLAFSRDSVSENQLLYDVALFNFSQFMIKDFDLKQNLNFNQDQSAVIVSGFEKLDEADWYHDLLTQNAEISQKIASGSIQVVCITQANYDLIGKHFSLADYLEWRKTNQ